MSDVEQITALHSEPVAKPDSQSTIAAGSASQARIAQIPDTLSILPVRGFVVFPGTIVPLSVRLPEIVIALPFSRNVAPTVTSPAIVRL